jgi:hypothetical protein
MWLFQDSPLGSETVTAPTAGEEYHEFEYHLATRCLCAGAYRAQHLLQTAYLYHWQSCVDRSSVALVQFPAEKIGAMQSSDLMTIQNGMSV